MRKYCLLFCTVLLCALLCTGCAVSLTDALPPLDDAATKLQNVTSVTVCRHTDDAHVTLTDPMALDALYMQLDGIRGTRDVYKRQTLWKRACRSAISISCSMFSLWIRQRR